MVNDNNNRNIVTTIILRDQMCKPWPTQEQNKHFKKENHNVKNKSKSQLKENLVRCARPHNLVQLNSTRLQSISFKQHFYIYT